MAKRVSNQVFWILAPLFALIGGGGGALAAHSYVSFKSSQAERVDITPLPAPRNKPANLPAATNENRPPERLPEPPPQPEPEPALPRLVCHVVAGGEVKARPLSGREYVTLADGAEIAPGSRVQVSAGYVRLSSAAFAAYAAAPTAFTWTDARCISVTAGRVAVRAHAHAAFEAGAVRVSASTAAFVLEPRQFKLTEGGATLALGNDVRELSAPAQSSLESGLKAATLEGEPLRAAERETLGPHRALLLWDCESPDTTPALARLQSPGAYGSTACAAPVAITRGVGAGPGGARLIAAQGTRLRMRVLTDAPEVLIEMRMHSADGYRIVDAKVAVPRPGAWCWLDLDLSALRAGEARHEPGWVEGMEYRGLRVIPQTGFARPDPNQFQLDDLLVYIPR